MVKRYYKFRYLYTLIVYFIILLSICFIFRNYKIILSTKDKDCNGVVSKENDTTNIDILTIKLQEIKVSNNK